MKIRHKKFIYLSMLLAILSLSQLANARDNVRLLRYADIHKDKVTFVYAGEKSLLVL